MFSKIYLQLVGEAPDVRAVVVAREILYQSPIWLTPYLPDNTIDMMALDEYFAEAYGAVDATREHIDTGAIILTGEALKRVNARTIATLFAQEAGQFVVRVGRPPHGGRAGGQRLRHGRALAPRPADAAQRRHRRRHHQAGAGPSTARSSPPPPWRSGRA